MLQAKDILEHEDVVRYSELADEARDRLLAECEEQFFAEEIVVRHAMQLHALVNQRARKISELVEETLRPER